MPDVKWYAGGATGTITINTTPTTGGTANRVLYDTGLVIAASQLERTDADTMTLTGELQVTRLGVGVAASATYPLTISTTATGSVNQGAFGNWTTTAGEGTVLFQSSDHLAKIGVYSTGGAKGLIIGANASTGVGDAYHDSTGVLRLGSGGQFAFSSGTAGYAAAPDTGVTRHAASSMRFSNGSTGTASVVLGTSSHPSTPASTYLFIEGVSGAGGTPTTSHITPGSGVAIYVQAAHDAQATKFVIAYNNYNGINYLVGTLDGTTATWTNSTTRP